MNTSLTKTAIALSALLFSAPSIALNQQQAKQLVQPFYDFLSNPGSASHVAATRQVIDPDWKSFYSNSKAKGLEQTIESIQGFGRLIPDLNWDIKDVKVAGNTIIVRGEASGTPVGDFFGVPHSGKSFKIMSIDMHTVKAGKVYRSYHIEDWAGAMKQLAPSK